jgi:hypothetical protein
VSARCESRPQADRASAMAWRTSRICMREALRFEAPREPGQDWINPNGNAQGSARRRPRGLS